MTALVDDAPPPGADTRASGARLVLGVYLAATFLAATLLFLVQPMVAKMLLPRLGGSAAVWNTAMVFFQAVLLAGYGFAHLTLGRLGPRRQSVLEVIGLGVPLLVLPIAVPGGWQPPDDGTVALWTLGVLGVMVGLPFFFLSTVSPTLQRWFSATDHPHAADPYFLYAAGNVGSLLALLAYPFLLEPVLDLDAQARLWTAGYATFVVLAAACALLLRRHAAGRLAPAVDRSGGEDRRTARSVGDGPDGGRTAPTSPPLAWSTRLRWIGFAAVPSALMLGVTHHLSSDVASMPLLWVVPLSLYLATFIIAFGRRPDGPVRVCARLFKLLAVPLVLSFLGLVGSLWFALAIHLGVFFCAAMVAHGRLAAERPAADRLTEFYLLLSVGGVVGGILTALVAPVVFPSVLEYPIAIVLGLAVLPASAFGARSPLTISAPTRSRWLPTPRTLALGAAAVALAVAAVLVRADGSQAALTAAILVAATAVGGAFILARSAAGFAAVVGVVLLVAVVVPANPTRYAERTFFGVHRVYDDRSAPGRHVLLNGSTVHGMENTTGPSRGIPLTYYHPTGPIGQWFAANEAGSPRTVGLVGMGSGALAAYGRPGDRFVYYEIDPAVTHIARDPDLFTFVPESAAIVEDRIGDGRLSLEGDADARYDLLVLDAFSSDAIPLHLLTSEAVELYTSRLADKGVLAFHISNRYFDFGPVLARLAAEHGLVGRIEQDQATPAQAEEGKLDATWVLLARSEDDLGPLASDPRWEPIDRTGEGPLWTDQFSDLLHVFRWEG
ncbi:MAG: fused MFS/spermidine synthase [Acidimicrobiales bacterium]